MNAVTGKPDRAADTFSRYLELALYRSSAELRVEASRNYIGILWWIAEPLLYLATFYLVFAVGFRAGGADFVPFLLCGLVPWKWFGSTVTTGANAIVSNQALVQQVYLPKTLLVVTVLLANFWKYLIILSLLLVFLLLYGYPMTTMWLALPVLMLLQGFLIFGFASIGAALLPFIPDLRLIIDNGMLILFFSAGVFFDVSTRSEQAQAILAFNPMVHMISAYRDVLMHGVQPAWGALGVLLLVAAGASVLGVYLLRRYERVFPRVL